MLKLAGLPIPENIDGGDLMKLYGKPEHSIHESLALINVWGKVPTHALGVVTKDMKYIHWGYAAEGFTPTEELYHLSKDPLELTDQSANSKYLSAMQQMRNTYDQHLSNWQSEAVSYNNYQKYGTIFDRNTAWSDKAALLAKPEKQDKKKKR